MALLGHKAAEVEERKRRRKKEVTCRKGREGGGGGGRRWRDEECEEVRGGSQVVGCWWRSLTGPHPQHLAVPLCFVLHLAEKK